ncbi:Serine threonine protein kinase [Lasiodiplodia theobromae]|uniref:Serine threonine protein kinase n=1 Tax=Lasiodiplodia theobromae TaxID=45133 RepID=UPI0015C3C110|nr:Serine threonine protein kinase [Lasiodiplodia theobromae]KAF4539104.1 Serine threonine protein kinase [Lasiodiplodia theobromae]
MGDAKEVTGSPKSVSKQHDSIKLRDRICRATLSVTSSRDRTEFVPANKFNELVTEESIEAEIPDSPRELIEFIYKDAKMVFMTVLDIKEHDNQSELGSMMQSFRASGFTDKHLPIRNPRDLLAEHDNGHHFPVLPPDTFDHEKWTTDAKVRFYRSQWTFLAPIFTEGKLKHDFPQETMLPFTEISPSVREGFFSTVSQVKIHPAHQKVLCKENGKALCFAIKELKYLDHEPGYDPATAWELEANSLHQIGKLNDSHLIKPVAAYKIGIRHCFIFEWAEGGTLRDYWKNYRHPVLDKALILNVLKQLLGLAKALEVLHTGYGADNHSEDEARSESHWRHGDLKPDNILRFQDLSEVKELGELRIADLGLAKLHTFRTNARNKPTGTKYLTSHYEPPEAFTLPNKPRSRLYDLWSMGCVILEFIIWLLYGSDSLDEFVDEKLGKHEHGTIYYLIEGPDLPSPSARMNEKIASKWMDDILPVDPDCQPEKTAIGDLLMMVKTKLLVIKLPDDGSGSLTPSRASATDFRTCIDDILKRATDDEKQLLGNHKSKDLDLQHSSHQTWLVVRLILSKKLVIYLRM